MQSIRISAGMPLSGEVTVPGDKSISHRAAIMAAIADGESAVTNFLAGEDCVNTAGALSEMGVGFTGLGGPEVRVRGVGLEGLRPPGRPLDMGNSGTGMRLLSGLLAGQGFGCTLTGDSYLTKRPMDRVVTPLSMMGARITGNGDRSYPPLVFEPRGRPGLKAIDFVSPIASAQVKSSVLLAGLYADGVTSVTEPMKSRDHTERMLRYFGVEIAEDGLTVSVRGGQRLSPREFTVPADLSSAAFFMVAAAITPGSRLTIRDVGVNPTRSGIIDVLRLMSASITLDNPKDDGPEPVADITVEHSELRGIEIGGEILLRSIDEFPIICVAAACADGETVIRDASELRVKESDRIAAMASELKKLGVHVKETPDGMVIEGGTALRAAEVDSHGDHRVAMSMAVAGLVAAGGAAGEDTVVDDTACIDTSFPGFEALLESARGRR